MTGEVRGTDQHRIVVEDGDGVGLIAFDRPEVRNAFDLAMYRAVAGALVEAASSLLLPARMGWQRASAALLASERIDAHQAVEVGIALRVCPEGTVLDEAMVLARRIASFPTHATQEIKRLMLSPHRSEIAAARQGEEAAFAALFPDPTTNPGSGLTSVLEG